MASRTILFVGGGSIGHIAPSVAIWNQLQQMQPEWSAHFVCSPREDDAAFLEEQSLPYSVLDAPRASLLLPFKLIGAVRKAKRILDQVAPDLIFSKGSFVSLPLCIAARRKGIPIIIHESDAVFGVANRMTSKWAAHICTGFPLTTNSQQPTTCTGNPLRPDIRCGSKEEALRITGLNSDKPILLVIGGSQGAVSINEAIASQLDDLLLRCNIIHITGRGKSAETRDLASLQSYYQTEFADQELAHFYAAADAAVTRAGANAITELSASGIPSIVIPLRGVGHDHQYQNALVAAEYGAVHIEQTDLEHKLLPAIHTLISEPEAAEAAGEQFAGLANVDAAVHICEIIVQTLDSMGRDQ